MLNHSSATPHTIKSNRNNTSELNGKSKHTTKNKTLSLNGSITQREETTHVDISTKNKTLRPNGTSKRTISNALRQRAQSLINDRSINAEPGDNPLRTGNKRPMTCWIGATRRSGETIIGSDGLLANTCDQRR